MVSFSNIRRGDYYACPVVCFEGRIPRHRGGRMKRLFVLFIAIILTGCATCPLCPDEDIVLGERSGRCFLHIPRGTITPDRYWNMEEWAALMEEWQSHRYGNPGAEQPELQDNL